MERRSYGGAGLTGSAQTDLGRLLAALGVAVPVRHAVSTVVDGPASAIQTVALEDAVADRDLLAVAPTGSGKTLVFAIAVAHRLAGAPSLPLRPRAVVVAPTRELAVQNAEVLAEVGAGAGLRVATFVGGQPLSKDRRTLVAPVDIAVGTPGRLTDLIRTGALSTADVQVLVLDEADHLL
ncbi:DEAD/DEAH box helicase, partial [Dietzia sp. SLG310A2-38A2]|uniref:DEAD/DEAH box helicase n=1 Tax=Dietzia sp. SLG310A2-38A2 TaxID=1630643 RepID=UPI0015FCD22A|nr:DEAD/DEAH box helicase [Dietzia sp. SLG310A2-38A2]